MMVLRIVCVCLLVPVRAQVDTAFDLETGLAGDPFTVRGVVETALRF